jgi:hypothetical protein
MAAAEREGGSQRQAKRCFAESCMTKLSRDKGASIGQEFRRRVTIGPFEREENLRKLSAEGGASCRAHLTSPIRPVTSRNIFPLQSLGTGQAQLGLTATGEALRLLTSIFQPCAYRDFVARLSRRAQSGPRSALAP